MQFLKKKLSKIHPGWILFAFVLLLSWNTAFLYPLKLFVVFLHEVSHGLAALLTGGELINIEISHRIGGHAVTRGGSRFLILSSGYLGSLVFGGLILVLARNERTARKLSAFIALSMFAVSLFYIRNLFGFMFSLIFAATLLFSSLKLSNAVNKLLLRGIGFTSCLYCIFDIKSDIFVLYSNGSDASKLAELTWIPAFVWGTLWILISIVCCIYFLAESNSERHER